MADLSSPTTPAPAPTRPTAPAWRDLAHLPHCGHAPVLVDLALLRDTLAFARGVAARAGPVSRAMLIGRPQALLMSADALDRVLGDTAGQVSAEGGWGPLLGALFPRGLILRDGEDHRVHRRRMLPALRRDALERHLDRMAPVIAAEVDRWVAAGRVAVHDAARRLTLHLASDVFLGVDAADEVDAAHHDFVRLVDASAAIVRWRMPFTTYGRGLAARARLVAFLRARLAARRARPGDDLFSQLCVARDDDGLAFSDDDVVDHMIFLWMAAHDTTRSAITTLVRALAMAPEWQDRLREEAHPGRRPGARAEAPDLAALAGLEALGWAFKEALRLYPPIPTIARQLQAGLTVDGCTLPAGTPVTLFPLAVQRDPRWWPDPDRFDPERFSPARADPARHRSAWAPFGGGAHMCLGQHFAQMQVKAVLRALLARARWRLPAGAVAPAMAFAPIAHPVGGLVVALQAL